MKKLSRDSRTSLTVGILIFFSVVAVLSILVTAYRDGKPAEYEEILKECASDGMLVYGADDSAPPLRFVDEDGVYKGVVVDYVSQLSLELGIEISAVPYKWDDAIRALKEGETDLCDMFVNEERSRYFVFTDPIYTLRTIMVTRTGDTYELEDIHSMRVATQEGDYANWYMETNFPEAKLIYVHDVGKGLKLLLAGQVDGVIGDEPVVSYYAGRLGCNDEIATIETSLYEEPVCLALPKGKEKLVPVLNQAIRTINEKGQLEKIQQKWFGISTPLITTHSGSAAAESLLLILAVAFGCAVLVAQLNNRSLRRQVEKRTRELEISSQKLLQSSKMIAIGQLAGGMAHQIRNPLGIIRTQSFIIRNSHREDEALNRSLDYVDDSVKRASDIIDNVMNFWRVSDDTQTEIAVRQMLQSVVMLQEKDFVSGGIQVKIDCDPALRLVSSEDALKHILHNLVANSVDAMEQGGGRLTLQGRKEGSFVELVCEDTGCGISEKDRSNLFNPFFTTKEPGKGTGLGLFIVYSEVEKLGGTIEVKSREGEGTTFLIRIPQGQV